MTIKELCTKVALELNLPPKYVWEVYKSYWKAIRLYLSELPLKEDISEEEFSKLKTSINIPSLGKFYVDFGLVDGKKKKYERYNNNKI